MFATSTAITITAGSVAWYGALVATFSLVISALNYFRDRVKVKVKKSEGFLVFGDNLGGEIQIFIEAINTGRRTVTLSGAGLTLANDQYIAFMRPEILNFPYELEEGKSIQVWVDKREILRQVRDLNTQVTHAWYRDATGKVYSKCVNIK